MESMIKRQTHQCPYCKVIIDKAYLEINPFPEIPCPSCNTMVTVGLTDNSTDLHSSDKRTEKRCPVSLKVSYRSFDDFIEEYTKNVSRRGMFIRTKRPHKIHEQAELLLHVPGLAEPVRIIGEIAHVEMEATREEDCGIGIKFMDIDEQSRQLLIRFIMSQENCI